MALHGRERLGALIFLVACLCACSRSSSSINGAWELWLYSHEDNGLAHLAQGRFASSESCVTRARELLPQGIPVDPPEPKPIADDFLCGRDCTVDAAFGAAFISEFRCAEKIGR